MGLVPWNYHIFIFVFKFLSTWSQKQSSSCLSSNFFRSRVLGAAPVTTFSNATDSRGRNERQHHHDISGRLSRRIDFLSSRLPRQYTLAAEKDGSSLMLPHISVSVGPLIIRCNVITTAMCLAVTGQKNAPAILLSSRKYILGLIFF